MKNLFFLNRRSAMAQAGSCAAIKGKAMRPTNGNAMR